MIVLIFGEPLQSKTTMFKKRSMLEHAGSSSGLKFKKIEGRKAIRSTECAIRCSKHDACRSFYVDDGACVFGLRDDVTEFANGDDVTPADGQTLITKRKNVSQIHV